MQLFTTPALVLSSFLVMHRNFRVTYVSIWSTISAHSVVITSWENSQLMRAPTKAAWIAAVSYDAAEPSRIRRSLSQGEGGVFAVAELLPHRDGVLRSFLLDAMSPRRGTARRMIDRRAVRRSTLVFRLKRVRRLRSDKNMPTNRRKHIRLVCDAARKIA